MVGLLKGLLKGLLYIVALPFFIIVIVLYGVYGLLLFFYMLIKMFVIFFTGKSVFEDLPEDRAAKALLSPKPVEAKQEDAKQKEQVEEPEERFAPFSNDADDDFEPLIAPEEKIEEEPAPSEPMPTLEEEFDDQDIEDFEDISSVQEEIHEETQELQNVFEESEPVEEEESFDEIDFGKPFEPTTEEPLERYEPKGSKIEDDLDDGFESSSGVKIERS